MIETFYILIYCVMLFTLKEVTLMVGLTAYLVHMIQSIYTHFILVLFCLLYTYVQLFILPTCWHLLDYCTHMLLLANIIYTMCIKLFGHN